MISYYEKKYNQVEIDDNIDQIEKGNDSTNQHRTESHKRTQEKYMYYLLYFQNNTSVKHLEQQIKRKKWSKML